LSRLQTGSYPTSVDELAAWAKQHATTATEARQRFVQFVVLASISSSPAFGSMVAFKGGNALRFVYANLRSTLDLDFSAEAGFPDEPIEIRRLMDAVLKAEVARYRVKARCQTIHRKPPGREKTTPTYSLKLGYQLPGDRSYQNFEEYAAVGKPFSSVVEVEISLNDVFCETEEHTLSSTTKPIRVCTLDDIIAEKLRALLQQVPRNRSRPQDVYDVASTVRRYGPTMDRVKVASFLARKSEARGIVATRGAFNDAVREKAAIGYDDEVRPFTTQFIPFDEAWAEVLRFVAGLGLPA
jgi:predicted nucleotidyltransferase component of viral defense system